MKIPASGISAFSLGPRRLESGRMSELELGRARGAGGGEPGHDVDWA